MSQKVGIGTNTPLSSALLDVSSQTKGVLFPRMPSASRLSISNPAEGLLVYDLDSNRLFEFSKAVWAPAGNTTGAAFSLPFTHTASNTSPLFTINNTGGGSAIKVVSTGSLYQSAISAEATASGGYGVLGSSNNSFGVGVYGKTEKGIAVLGKSLQGGVALRGNSPNGLALYTQGKIRIYGANTNPQPGYVLTALDTDGNAAWKEIDAPTPAFRLEWPSIGNNMFQTNTWQKVHLNEIDHDVLHNISTTPNNTSPTATMSSFLVPQTGSYAFYFSLTFSATIVDQVSNIDANLMLLRNGSQSILYSTKSNFTVPGDEYVEVRGGTQVKLNAGDRIFLMARQISVSGNPVPLWPNPGTYFAGHLLQAE